MRNFYREATSRLITEAKWGCGNTMGDVLTKVREHVKAGNDQTASIQWLGDNAYGYRKFLKIKILGIPKTIPEDYPLPGALFSPILLIWVILSAIGFATLLKWCWEGLNILNSWL